MTYLSRSRRALYQFSDCQLDVGRYEIRRNGIPVSAEPRVFELLAYLIENRERVIDKGELQQAIWGGASITDSAITRCVTNTRRLVGDDSKRQAIIKTLHGQGYRFVAELKVLPRAKTESAPALEESHEPPVHSDALSIAVLPFGSIGIDSDQEHFAEGITAEISAELSRFGSLFLTSLQSAPAFKDSPEGVQALAQKLGVKYIVQGSIRRSPSRIRITVHLTEAASKRRLWSEHYDREVEEVAIIREDVAQSIAATIGGRVEAHRGQQRLEGAGVTASDYILRAKRLHNAESKLENIEALGLLNKALSLDPNNACAHAWLASVHLMNSWYQWTADPDQSMRLAKECGLRSLALDDSECTGHYLYADLLHCLGEYELAETHIKRAFELNPNCIATRGIYALLLVSTGRAEQALQHIAASEKLDPFGLSWTPWAKGAVMYAVGRYPEAIHALNQIDHLDNTARPWLAAAFTQNGDLKQARQVLEKFVTTARHDMTHFPGRDVKIWRGYLCREMASREEKDFDDFYQVLVKAGWLEILDAMPESAD